VASADLKGDLQVEASALAVLPLPRFSRDPIDRLLVAQAQLEGLRFPNADDNLVAYEEHAAVVPLLAGKQISYCPAPRVLLPSRPGGGID